MEGGAVEIAAAGAAHGKIAGYATGPPQGSGPGLVLCAGSAASTEGVRQLADLFGAEGYVVLAAALSGPDALDAALGHLRAMPACQGRSAVVGFGDGAALAIHAAGRDDVACVIAHDPVGADMPRGRSGEAAIVIHAGIAGGAAARLPDPSPATEIYVYPDMEAGFAEPLSPAFNRQAADMAHSRTIAALRRTIGPIYDLNALWEAHRACEFDLRDADATMKTMVPEPYVNHVPTLTGGYGHARLHRFYERHFIPKNPKDMRGIPISRTVGADRVVNENILCFTHDVMIDWMLPGVPPTGRYVEVAVVGVITFRGDKLVHEHIYWDQASVLVQIGLLDPAGLPLTGIDSARKVLDPSLPSNALMPNWDEDGLP